MSQHSTQTQDQAENTVDDLPVDVAAELEHVSAMSELLSSNRIWLPGFSPLENGLFKGGIIAAIATVLASVVLAIIGGSSQGTGIIAAAAIFAAVMVAGVVISAAVFFRHNSSPQPAFVLDSDGHLWCVEPLDEEIAAAPEFSRREIVTLREELDGYARRLSNPELAFALNYIRAIRSLQEGSPSEDYDVSFIEDIVGYGDDDDDGQAAPTKERQKEIDLVYTDRISGELQRISIERVRWKEFVAWLDQEFEYADDE